MPLILNALIDGIALVVVTVVMVADRRTTLASHFSRALFRLLMLLLVGVLITDMLAWLLDGVLFPGSIVLLYVLNTLYYILQIIFCYVWLLFAVAWQQCALERSPIRLLCYALPMVAELAVILLNPFTGWIFSIDARSVYDRGAFRSPNLIPYCLYIVGSLAVTAQGWLKAENAAQKQRSVSLLVFMFLPVCGMALQSMFYGISWIWPFTALTLMMVYLYVQQQFIMEQRIQVLAQQEAEAEMKNELANSRVAIMLSQIQPHFLYNALSTIQALCDKNPVLAKQATTEFTEFLRGNMDSLTADKPIAFQWELEHTKHYLSLEKLRFGKRLTVCYDIQATLFRLPTLTLQPIVENAVRYGVTQRIQGGTVNISSREEGGQFVICVTDDGVGFNPMLPHSDGRTHVGIQNVRERLERMCGGTLTIESTPGIGTTATICLPRAQALEEEKC